MGAKVLEVREGEWIRAEQLWAVVVECGGVPLGSVFGASVMVITITAA